MKPVTASAQTGVAIRLFGKFAGNGLRSTGFWREISSRASTPSITASWYASFVRKFETNASSISSGNSFEQDTWTCKKRDTTVWQELHKGVGKPNLSQCISSRTGRKSRGDTCPLGTGREEKTFEPPSTENCQHRKERLVKKGATRTKVFRTVVQRIRSIPAVEVNDPNFIRIKYLRYADDWLMGILWTSHARRADQRGTLNSSWDKTSSSP